MPIRCFAPRRMDKSAFGDPKSRERTFLDLFVEGFSCLWEAVHDAVVDVAQACARISDFSATAPILMFAEVQTCTGDGHQPLQHEVAQYDGFVIVIGRRRRCKKGQGNVRPQHPATNVSLWRVHRAEEPSPEGRQPRVAKRKPNSDGFHAIIG